YWYNLVKNGDPNGFDEYGTAITDWKPYSDECKCSMIFSSKGAVSDIRDKEDDAMDELLHK
ncbi:MAG: hypothetical protein ILN61_00965, partial [Lachnospiraceae bacterium]|nr:hypothetical protein [Lachnospiraceae bacterium]